MDARRAVVRVVVCGPAGSGKTCFVTAAAMETFPERVPPHVPPTLLPTDALPGRVSALLIDTSSRAEDRAALAAALSSAHAVVLCYALDAPRAATLAALREDWLPELRRAGGTAPVILLGCKLDLRASSAPTAAPIAAELLEELPRLEASLECSAKMLVAVHEAVYAAHRAVLYPTPPLFDATAQALAPDAVAALRRIFTVCDGDADGALSSSELNAFQEQCFGAPLTPAEMEDVRRVVAERLPNGAGVTADGTALTLTGFLYLHALFIEHGRADTVWAVLKNFGYNAELRLSFAALGGAVASGMPLATRPADASVELSERAASFVDAMFTRTTGATQGMLQMRQLDDMFASAPGGAATATAALGWTSTVNWQAAFASGAAGLSGRAFSALWAYAATVHPMAAVEHLMYLGYPGNANSVLWLGKRRAAEQSRRRPGVRGRCTLQVLVCGPHRAAKSALLDALASLANASSSGMPAMKGADASTAYAGGSAGDSSARAGSEAYQQPPVAERCAAALFEVVPDAPMLGSLHVNGTVGTAGAAARMTLVLRELNDSSVLHAPASADILAAADAIIFVFDADSSSSFAAAADELASLASRCTLRVPALLVAAHTDGSQEFMSLSDDEGALTFWDNGRVEAFCASLGLHAPVTVDARLPGDPSMASMFTRVIAEAISSTPTVPETRAAQRLRLRRQFLRRTCAYGAGAAGVLGASVLAYRWYKRYRRSD